MKKLLAMCMFLSLFLCSCIEGEVKSYKRVNKAVDFLVIEQEDGSTTQYMNNGKLWYNLGTGKAVIPELQSWLNQQATTICLRESLKKHNKKGQ